MCPSSSRSSSAGISDLFKNYRLITADKSQVCDGRNLESLRLLGAAEPPKTNTSEEEKSSKDKLKEVENLVGAISSVKGYRPVRSSRSKTDLTGKVQQPLLQLNKTKQKAQAGGNQNQEWQLSSSKPKTSSFLPNPFGFGSDHALDLDDSCHPELTKEQESQAASHQEVKKSVKQERRSTMQHESRVSKESDTGGKQRRSSAGDCASTTSDSSSQKRVTMRKLSEPMHRCSLTNASVNGIMRPARYSSNNLSGMVYAGSLPARSSNERIRKCTSQVSLHALSPSLTSASSSNRLSQGHNSGASLTRSSGSLMSTKPRRTMSIADMANANWNSYPTSSPTDQEAKDKWVASGVAFSKNMEVYVFKK